MSYGISVIDMFTTAFTSGGLFWRELIKAEERAISFLMINCME
jgi:hypothetical protein